jgi:tetratricopeptide (TPR) repeat protein
MYIHNLKQWLWSTHIIALYMIALVSALSLAPGNVLAEEQPAALPDVMTDAEAQRIFELAMQDRDSGKVFSAIEKFEYILSRRPSLNRARLELAVSYHRAKDYDDALREFQTVLDDPKTPEKVRLAILAYLGQLTSDELKPKTENSFSFYTKIGAAYNSNINYAPLRGSTDYQIPDGEDQSSPGLDTFLSASHRYKDNVPLDFAGSATLFEWQSQVSWTGQNYTRVRNYNVNTFSISTGPALIATGRWRGAISLQLDHMYFGDSVLGNFLSVNPLLTFDLGNYQNISLEASYTNNDFSREEDKNRDGSSTLVGASYTTYLPDVAMGLETGVRYTDLSAEDKQYAFTSGEIYFGGFKTFAVKHNVFLNIRFQQYDYDAPDTISGKIRDELESRFELGYNYDISDGLLKNWTLTTSLSKTKNSSNVDAFSYERYYFLVNLNRYFI